MIEIKRKLNHLHHVVRIYHDEPFVQSYASLVALNDFYHKQDDSRADKFKEKMKRIEFSRNFLTDLKKIEKSLTCVYCGKQNLLIELEGMLIPDRIKATIDHVNPISLGVDFYDTGNLVCACGTCNGKKANKPLEVFLKNHAKNANMAVLAKFLK